MQPGRKCGLTTKRSNLTVELEKRFLGKVLGLSRISRHPETKGIHAPLMQSVKLLESVSVTALGLLDRFSFAES